MNRPRIRRRLFERVALGAAHPADFLGAHLQHVKAALFSFLDKREGLHLPVLGPISEVYSDGVHKLMEMGTGDSHSMLDCRPPVASCLGSGLPVRMLSRLTRSGIHRSDTLCAFLIAGERIWVSP